MDSYNLHFERMSNVDLHTLSLPVNRLSPAKSNSSIVEQLAHHQHGKGDSAYSSFSGGSTAPDYASPFFPEDLQSSSFSHYADLKYVKPIYHPAHVLQSDSKTMDQLYRSVEAISRHYCNNSSTNVNHHNSKNTFHNNNNKVVSKQEMPSGAPTQSSHPPAHPPPIPTRMDSYIATKNMENNRSHQQHAEVIPQQPQSQQPPKSYHRRSQQHSLKSQSPEKLQTDAGNSAFNSDPVYSVWKAPQEQPPQGFRPHLQSLDQTRASLNQDSPFIMDNKAAQERHESKDILSGSPPKDMCQSDHMKLRRLSTGSGYKGDHYKFIDGTENCENLRRRAHSEYDWLGSDHSRAASPKNPGNSFINSSIQHKGQFYFVTGVCKVSDSDTRRSLVSVCSSEAGSESSTVVEKHWVREKQRSHSTMDNLFRPHDESSSHTSSSTVLDKNEAFTSSSHFKDMSSKSLDQENHRPSFISTRPSRSFDALEEIDTIQSRDIGRHTPNNPIFYCGPDKNSISYSTPQMKAANSLIMATNNELPNYHKREEQPKRGKRQPLGDVASERINKETTPLLYHLTEANRAALQPKKDVDITVKGKETILNKPGHGNLSVNDNERAPQSDKRKSNSGDIISVAYNTLDDSFKKYYKEKLKDAQSKVLKETSFKRRDLQLSWPHRVRQKPEMRPTVVHSFTPSQDSETSTDTITPSVTSEDTEKGSIKEEIIETQAEVNNEMEKESGRNVNMAQPQVPRIGGRRRLTPEQKKMCYSEPEKLNQIGSVPTHSTCRSFGNESESPFSIERETEEREQQGEPGLVATRRKLFETRCRAFSASGSSKTNLKHLQHKALVEYMERKTGQKVPEPQQPAPQVPPPPRQRHSIGERPCDWALKPLSGNSEGKNTKKKLHRPHSAGRILDSTTSSVRYAQFFSAQSYSGQYAEQSNQHKWSESRGPHQGKAASAESLLEQPDPPQICRNRSTSTPHALQEHIYEREPSPANAMETCSPQKNSSEISSINPVSETYKRVVAQRGKSMEELGTSKLAKPSALSKSSEQLDQLWRNSTGPGGPDMDKRTFPFVVEVKGAHGLKEARKTQTELAVKEPEIVGEKTTQGLIQNQTQKKDLLKQNSTELGEELRLGTSNLSMSTSPASCPSTQARVHSGSHDLVTDGFMSSRPPSETSSNPPSPRVLDMSEEIKSTSDSPVQTKPPCESRPCFSRVRTSLSVVESETEQSVDEPISDLALPDSSDEVSLSCGVTTNPSMWILPPEDGKKEVLNVLSTESTFEDQNSCTASQELTSETSLTTSTSNSDVSQEVEEEKNHETEDVKVEENQLEERGAPEGETESLKEIGEKPKWEELVEAVVKADQSLVRVFYPLTSRKTALMLMEQLLSEDTLLMEEHYKKKQEQGGATESTETVKGSESTDLPATDSLKRQYTDMEGSSDITEKKRLLVSSIEERVCSLEKMHGVLQTAIDENVSRGQALELLVRERCQPLELERYSLFIGDLERVVSLLLCLSARLARVQNALSTVDQHTDAEEKQSLDSRYRLLCKQREDAKDLKDNLDRRENLVSSFLSRQLTAEQLQDYRRFVQTKASLLIRQKDLEEKQRLGEEQLEALHNSLNL